MRNIYKILILYYLLQYTKCGSIEGEKIDNNNIIIATEKRDKIFCFETKFLTFKLN